MGKILITGVSGNLGKSVATEIIQRTGGQDIVLLMRKIANANEDFFKAGVEFRYGDYDNFASLESAFQGIDKLYLVSSSETAKRSVQHINVIQAAKKAGVKHIIYTSYIRRVEDASSPIAFIGAGHLAAEHAIFESGIPFTILKQALFFENIPWLIGKDVLGKGSFALPAKEGKVAFVAREDLAMAAVNILLSTGHENKTYMLTGSQKYSFNDIANILSELSGKTITYISPTDEAYIKQMHDSGIPLEDIDRPLAFSRAIAQGESDFQTTELQEILQRPPQDLVDFLKNTYRIK